MHRAGLEHLAVGQGVGHVAGQGELLHAGGQRGVRRRLEGAAAGLLPRVGGVVERGGVVQVEVDLGVGRGGLLAARALADLARGEGVLVQQRGVVRRVAHLGVDLVGVRARAAPGPLRGLERGGLVVPRLEVVGVTPHDPVADLAQPGGHLVDGRRGHDEHPEHGQQHQQRHDDVDRLEQVGEQLGDHEPDRTTGLLQRAGVTQPRGRRAVGDVHDPEHAEEQGSPADHLATRGAVALGVAQVAPGDEDEQQRHQPGDQPDRAGHDGAGGVAQAARELPPHGAGDDHGQAEEEQPGAVATVLRLELGGPVAHAAHGPAHEVGHAQPRRDEHAGEGDEDGGDGTGPGADRPGCRARAGSCRGLASGPA